MLITHAIIKQKHQENVKRHEARTSELRDAGQRLLASYKDSLGLASDMWEDKNKVPRSYISTGFINQKGLFQQKNISSFEIDENLRLKFVISTVVDDSQESKISYSYIPVEIYKEIGHFHFGVGIRNANVKVYQLDGMDSLFEVCGKIKEAVMSDITDARLDW